MDLNVLSTVQGQEAGSGLGGRFVCARARARLCVCVCVRERERECVCVCVFCGKNMSPDLTLRNDKSQFTVVFLFSTAMKRINLNDRLTLGMIKCNCSQRKNDNVENAHLPAENELE